jgi:hypothetical protein
LKRTNLFTTIAPSSMMQPEPITIGPAMANIVAFGCTIVPELDETVLVRTKRTDLDQS